MGYVIGTVFLLLFILLIAGMALGRSRKRMQGHLSADRPVSRTQPAADEPTPGASDSATPAQVQHAQRKTPPA